MTIILRYDRDLSAPLTWTGGSRDDGTRTALAKCANGHISSLSQHEIDSDGKVRPSLVCPHDGCYWHVYVKLENWKP